MGILGEDGYTITFSDGTIAVLRNGKDGKDGTDGVDGVDGKNGKDGTDGTDGKTPTVGIKLVNGIYYWTVNGELLLDDNGQPIPVTGNDGIDGTDGTDGTDGKDGITPFFGILDGHWVVSYDYGDTWKTLGLTSDTDYSAYIDPDKETDDYIVLVVGATEVQIPKEKAFSLNFTVGDNNGVDAGTTKSFPYTISGVNPSDEIDVDVIAIMGDWAAELIPSGNDAGTLKVTASESASAKITVYAANHKGKADIRTIVFEAGVLEGIYEAKDIDWEGGELDLAVRTNQKYNIFIPIDAEDWLTVEPETRVYEDNYKINVSKNETGAYRIAKLQLLNTLGKVVKTIVVVQYANPSEATDLASVVELPENTPVVVNGVTVVAASKVSTIITDGKAFSYVAGYTGTPGTVLNVTGTKKDDELGLGYIEPTAIAVAEAQPVEVDPKANYLYYGVGSNGYDYFYTSANGLLVEKDGVLTVAGYTEPQQFVIENPTQDVSALVGKFIAFSGWIKTVDYEYGEKEDMYLVMAEAHEVVFAEETNWTPFYGGPNSSESGYPEIVGNTVATPQEGVYYALTILHDEDVDKYGSLANLLMSGILETSDSFLYAMWYYTNIAHYSWEKAFGLLAHSETASDTWRLFDYGVHYAVAVGVDSEGRLTGKYAVTPFEKKDPAIHAAYEDFLGDWVISGSVVSISPKVEGQSYLIAGLPGYDGNNYPAIEAIYDAKKGKFTIMEQELKNYTNSNYGACKRIFQGVFKYGNGAYGYLWFNSDEYDDVPMQICTGGILEATGELVLNPGSCPYGAFVGMRYAWVIVNESSPYYRNGGSQDTIALPATLARPQIDMAAYNKWVGTWTVGSETWAVAAATEGKSYAVTGIGGSSIPFEAKFNATNNAFELYEQADVASITFTDPSTGEPVDASLCLYGNIQYQGKVYYWGEGTKIATAILGADNTATLTPRWR